MVAPNRIEGARVGEELGELVTPEHLITVPPEVQNDSPFHVAHMYQRLASAINDGTPCEPSFEDALELYGLLETISQSDAEGGTRKTI